MFEKTYIKANQVVVQELVIIQSVQVLRFNLCLLLAYFRVDKGPTALSVRHYKRKIKKKGLLGPFSPSNFGWGERCGSVIIAEYRLARWLLFSKPRAHTYQERSFGVLPESVFDAWSDWDP